MKAERFDVKNVTCVYPKLGERDEYQGQSKFKIDLLTNDIKDFAPIQEAIDKIVKEKKLKNFRSPIQAGEDKMTQSGEPAKIYSDFGFYAKVSTKFDIFVCNQYNKVIFDSYKKIGSKEPVEELFYSGCKVTVRMSARYYKSASGAGIALDLYGVKFEGDGDRLSSGSEDNPFGAEIDAPESAEGFPAE